ncbi:TVP38/TMEM64 family protein [Dethiosulfovibrio salsuginis]|uniref:TVP38/TMEM64 family membrane protein n=1 Tax=Dethiosulfovibrio salsuginis TaxID=561720 RepID=A0A1X7KPA9_9BACT|nr:TVP38/TMEM64 family protein [Dethiosulfovibrio salsuginis]SMG43008.1 Uncharacterized membrane protein YdjX, TVP38/TMEM64 family, SNARE-associated domain [Dethiosulfovibrio salsuginis]
MFPDCKGSKWLKFLLPVLVLALLLFLRPTREWLFDLVDLFHQLDVGVIREYILSFGIWAPVISFWLMIFQSVVAPLPAFLITFANAGLFGWWKGAILSWSSAMAGAALCFYISRLYGRGVVEKLTSKAGLEGVDRFFDRYGDYAVLVARLLPFVSFDIVSYGAGLTSMKFWPFFIATGIGQLPATIVYSYVGGMLTGGTRLFVTGLLILFAMSTFIALWKKIHNDKIVAKVAKPSGDVH